MRGGGDDSGEGTSTSLSLAKNSSVEAPPTTEFPNWRVMPRNRRAPIDIGDDDDRDESIARSPFCHLLPEPSSDPTTSATSPAATAEAAPWSSKAYADALELHRRFETCDDPYLAPLLKAALHDLGLAYRLYGPHCLVGSYNGGKDAVVILHLLRAVHAAYCRDRMAEEGGEGFVAPRPRVIYFQHPDEFPEVLSLLDETVGEYDLDMLAFEEGISFGEGLATLVENNLPPGKDGLSHYGPRDEAGKGTVPPLPPPHPLAFVLGTRKDDPNAGSQGTYAPSSHYMPPFMRINPVLDWTYGHVWHFLRSFHLSYCSLYDDGYTSLGTTKDTFPCPALAKPNDGGFWPAYMLREWDQERAGRVKKPKKKPKVAEAEGGGDAKTSLNAKESVVKAAEAAVKGSYKAENGDDLEKGIALQKMTISQSSSTVSLPATAETDAAKLSSPNDDETSPNPGRTQTVALLVIGDELLKGQTPDVNIIAAARAFREQGVSLSRVSVVSDDRMTISDEIRRVSEEVDIVVTSGGIGPTHDDVTVKSVAEALGCEMELHGEMAKLLKKKMDSGDEKKGGSDGINGTGGSEDGEELHSLFASLSEGQRKMATLPCSSRLRYLSDNDEDWPVLQCKNVFVLPGVPTFFERKIQQLASYLSANGIERGATYRIVLSVEENSIVEALNAAVMAHPHVTFGSYPLADHPEFKTVVTLEGRFYNGGYNASSGRVLGLVRAASAVDGDRADGTDAQSSSSLMFTKEEMDLNVKLALDDLVTGLPSENILRVDNRDDLNVTEKSCNE